MFLVYFVSFFRTPLILAFHVQQMNDQGQRDFEILTDFAIGIEMMMRFFLAPDRDSLQKPDFLRSAYKYLTTMFLVDAVGTLPGLITLEQNTDLFWLKLARFFRVTESVGRSREAVIRVISRFWDTPIRQIDNVFKLVTMLAEMLFFLHFSACLYLAVAFLNPGQSDLPVEFNVGATRDREIYLSALYFVMTTFSMVGYGDLGGNTNEEMLVLIVLEFVGISVFSTIIARISRIIAAKELVKDFMKEKEENMDKWVLWLANANPLEHLNPEFELALTHFLKEEQQYALQGYLFRYEFYKQLSPTLKNDLIFTLAGPTIATFANFFSDNRDSFKASRRFVRKIVVNLVPKPYLANQTVIARKEMAPELYLIYKGSVTVYSDVLHQRLTSLHPGSYFGDLCVLFNLQSSFIYQTSNDDEIIIFSIKADVLNAILEDFPDERRFLRRRALKRRRFFRYVRDLKRLLLLRRYLRRTMKTDRPDGVYKHRLDFLNQIVHRAFGNLSRRFIVKVVEKEFAKGGKSLVIDDYSDSELGHSRSKEWHSREQKREQLDGLAEQVRSAGALLMR